MREVAVGVLTREREVLACQRLESAVYGLKWEFPGGKLEPGETPRQALERELHEELGIHVVAAEEFYRQEWIYPDGVANPERDGAFRVFYFLVPEFSGEPENRTFEQIRWVSVGELQALDILEGNKEAVAILAARGAAQGARDARRH